MDNWCLLQLNYHILHARRSKSDLDMLNHIPPEHVVSGQELLGPMRLAF